MKSRHLSTVPVGILLTLLMTNQYAFAAPANDNFASASLITGEANQISGNNIGATVEAGEPSHADTDGGASVWWAWSAPLDGIVAFDTFGSSFATLLAAYTGSVLSSLTPVASNDDSNDTQSKIVFKATAGTTYRIAVDGFSGYTGDINLQWEYGSPPDNDSFSSATPLTGSSGQVSGNNTFATSETEEPAHANITSHASVWWSWTAPSTGTVSLDTFGSGFDTLLAAYTGNQLSELKIVAANDDASNDDTHSQITFEATAGTTYWIAVDGNDLYEFGDRGEILLSWTFTSTRQLLLGPLMLLLD